MTMPEPHWAGREPTPTNGGGGATTLTELSDVTGDPGFGKSPVDDGTSTFPLTRVTTQEDLDAILNSVAAVTFHNIGDPGEPPFQNGYRNTGDGWCPAGWRLTLNNVIHIQGSVSNDDPASGEPVRTPIFQLPANARPAGNLRFHCLVNDNATGEVVVWAADGNVMWAGYVHHAEGSDPASPPPIGYLSLDSISFSFGGASLLLEQALEQRS